MPAETAVDPTPKESAWPSYACGNASGGPSVNGPFLFALLKPAPARAQLSPLISWKDPVAPAVVNSAFSTSWVMISSPLSKTEPGVQVPWGLWLSDHVVES